MELRATGSNAEWSWRKKCELADYKAGCFHDIRFFLLAKSVFCVIVSKAIKRMIHRLCVLRSKL